MQELGPGIGPSFRQLCGLALASGLVLAGLVVSARGDSISGEPARLCEYPVESRCEFFRARRDEFDPRRIALREIRIALDANVTAVGAHDLLEIVEMRSGLRFGSTVGSGELRRQLNDALFSTWFPKGNSSARGSFLKLAASVAPDDRARACFESKAAREPLEEDASVDWSAVLGAPDALNLMQSARDLCAPDRWSGTPSCSAPGYPELRLRALVDASRAAGDTARDSELPKQLRGRLETVHGEYSSAGPLPPAAECDSGALAFLDRLSKSLSGTRDLYVHSKPVVRALESRYLGAANLARAHAAFDTTRESHLTVLESLVVPKLRARGVSEASLNRIRNRFIGVKLALPEVFKDGDFVAVGSGFPAPVLRDYAQRGDDGALKEFTGVQGWFTGGVSGSSGSVHLSALYLLMSETQPTILNAILGHEMGHPLHPHYNPEMGKVFDPMIACFRRTMRYTEGQEGEAIPDWWKTQAAAALMARAPDAEAKLRALDPFISDFCLYDRTDSFDFSRVHPHPFIRLNRVFGSNPAVRQALGACEPAPTCTLD